MSRDAWPRCARAHSCSRRLGFWTAAAPRPIGPIARSSPRGIRAVRVEADPIFVVDGKLWTSAGVTAGIDLALAMIEADLGRELALAVARRLVVFLKRPGGQAQFSATLALQRSGRFEALHEWMRANLARRPPSAGTWRAQAGMSERSLVRRYRAVVGIDAGARGRARSGSRPPAGGSATATARSRRWPTCAASARRRRCAAASCVSSR